MGQSDSEPFKGFPGFRPKFYEEADDPVRQSDREPFKGFLADDDGARRFMSALKARPSAEEELAQAEAEVRRQKAIFERSMEELAQDRAELPRLALEVKVALAKLQKNARTPVGPGRRPFAPRPAACCTSRRKCAGVVSCGGRRRPLEQTDEPETGQRAV